MAVCLLEVLEITNARCRPSGQLLEAVFDVFTTHQRDAVTDAARSLLSPVPDLPQPHHGL